MKLFHITSRKWADTDLVEAVLRRDNLLLERIYRDCRTYFQRHAAAIFVEDTEVDDLFHEALLLLIREIETRRIVVADGRVCRMSEGKMRPMTCTLTTFLMSVAKLKHWEQVRRCHTVSLDAAPQEPGDMLTLSRYADSSAGEDADEMRERIVSDSVLTLSPRCREILTLFYYEERTLDDILAIREENTSKEGLKTSKYKCMQRLRALVRSQFKRFSL